jgi:hypothetical protein
VGKKSTIHPRLAALYQDLLLSIPKLPELSIGNSKVLAFLRAWHYLHGAGVRGDYLEFGVFEGLGFRLAMNTARKVLPRDVPDAPRFFAFDSFQGLPEADERRDARVFEAGDYRTTRSAFERHTRRAARHWQTVVVEGFFSESLRPGLYQQHGLRRAAFVTIDCDLYPSTRDALRFAAPLLQTGTVLYFDDWYTSSGDMRLGEAGACADWLAAEPQLELVDYGDVGIMGKLFIANRKPGPESRAQGSGP